TDTDQPTNSSRTIRFTLDDGDGGTSAAHDVTVNVASVNDSPAFSGLDHTPTFVEGGSAVILDNNATIADAELGAADDFSGATLSLVRNGGANADDVFDGSGTLDPLVQGGNLVVGATTIGTVTTNSGGLLVLTFNSNATAARVNSVLQQISYANSSVMPPSSVQVDFTFDDGNAGAQGSGGALNDLGSVTVNLTSVNAAPTIDLDANNSSGATGADFDTTFTEGGGPVAIADSADAVLADIDSPNLPQLSVVISNMFDGASESLSADTSGTSITATYAAGTLTLSGTDTVANYQQVLRTIAYNNSSANPDATTRLIQFVAHDGAANSNVATARVDIVTVNDAPTAADDNFVTQVGKTLTIGAGGLLANDFDLDGNALTVIPVSGPITGTLTLAADGSFQFTPAANFTGSITFTYAVTDGIATSAPTTVTIQVAKPNDLSEVTPADILSAGPDPEPDPETLPDPQVVEEVSEGEDESELATAILPDTILNPDVPLVLTGGAVIQTTDDEILTLSIMPTSTPGLTDAVQESERIASLSDSETGRVSRQSRIDSTRASVSILGIAKFDSKLLWGDMENLQDDIKQSDIAPYYFAGTFAGFSGALSVGYVMWTVRGGLLATSLLAHLPAWSFVDPLLVLNELDDDDDTDDDSLEEMLDKTEKERENNGPVETEGQTVLQSELQPVLQPALQPTGSGETVI
uniref:Ig-like domain-containing protein n=1 Tax=Stieleria sp. TaxID=2795976 RepID=UPI00356924D7